jgi:hypothetical protein
LPRLNECADADRDHGDREQVRDERRRFVYRTGCREAFVLLVAPETHCKWCAA